MANCHRILHLIAGLVLLTALAGANPSHAAGAATIHFRIVQMEHKRAGYYDISAKYPVFLGSSRLAAYANQMIRAELDKQARDTRKEAVKYHGTGSFDFPYDLTIDTNVSLSRTDLISLSFDEYEYSGGANGLNFPVTLTFGWREGKPCELALSDIFAGPGNPLDTLSQAVMPMLKQRQASFVMDGEVKSLAGVEGTWGWYLNKDKQIVVEIGQEAVASHAEGSFKLPIPLSTFAGHLNTQGPLAGFLGSS